MARNEDDVRAQELPPPDITVRFDQPVARVRTYPVRQPNDDRGEFIVEVHASALKRCRVKLQGISRSRFPLAELLLAVGMLGLGATLSAITSAIPAGSTRGIIFYSVVPVVSVGALVGYGFLRHLAARELSPVIEDVLNELPDPDRTT